MKINWFSPLPPAKTEIALHTQRLLPALAERMQVTLWTDQKKWDERVQRYAAVRCYGPSKIPWREVHQADATFYNMGNNAEFHVGIWQASQVHPGVVILHDPCLHQFFAYCYRWLWGDKQGYLSVMERYYAAPGRRDAEDFWEHRLTVEYMMDRYPLTPLALEGALAAVVHIATAYDQLIREQWCPAAWAPLPYPARSWDSEDPGWAGKRGVPQPYRLIMFGYINFNRRLEAILQALASLPEKDQFHLDIYGQLWNLGPIQSLIDSLGLKQHVTIHGFVPEPELDAALENADLAFNLRYPSVGEASASQLRIWDHSLASLVTRVGWYETIPAEAVAFVRIDHEIEDIQAHLRAFLAKPLRFVEMGRRGRRLLQRLHSPAPYSRLIERIAEASPTLG